MIVAYSLSLYRQLNPDAKARAKLKKNVDSIFLFKRRFIHDKPQKLIKVGLIQDYSLINACQTMLYASKDNQINLHLRHFSFEFK